MWFRRRDMVPCSRVGESRLNLMLAMRAQDHDKGAIGNGERRTRPSVCDILKVRGGFSLDFEWNWPAAGCVTAKCAGVDDWTANFKRRQKIASPIQKFGVES